MVEMEEEKLRMREHFMKEVDVNKDKMVSLKEFMDYTTTKEFDKPDMNSYETVDQAKDRGHIYTKEELEEYKSIIDEHEQELKNKIEEMKTMSKEIMESVERRHFGYNLVLTIGQWKVGFKRQLRPKMRFFTWVFDAL